MKKIGKILKWESIIIFGISLLTGLFGVFLWLGEGSSSIFNAIVLPCIVIILLVCPLLYGVSYIIELLEKKENV